MGDGLNFDGGTHRDDDFTPQERAAMRQRNLHYDTNFLEADAFLKGTGLKWVSDMGKAFPSFLKTFMAFSVIGGGIAAAKSMGLF